MDLHVASGLDAVGGFRAEGRVEDVGVDLAAGEVLGLGPLEERVEILDLFALALGEPDDRRRLVLKPVRTGVVSHGDGSASPHAPRCDRSGCCGFPGWAALRRTRSSCRQAVRRFPGTGPYGRITLPWGKISMSIVGSGTGQRVLPEPRNRKALVELFGSGT